jgi:hypothetical protein
MLNQYSKEFIQFINDNHLHYVIVGGYAVAIHGHPRSTKDIEIQLLFNCDTLNFYQYIFR